MTETIGWLQIGLAFGGSVLITVIVFAILIWRDYRRDRQQK
ncbi:MAG: hypothetical protein AAFQ57_05900 [Cyanobacteria bacterium J06626_14]